MLDPISTLQLAGSGKAGIVHAAQSESQGYASRLYQRARLFLRRWSVAAAVKWRPAGSIIVAALSLALFPCGVSAGISFDSADIEMHEDKHWLNALAQVELNTAIESGLQSGVPLHFNADVSIKKVRTWWWDKTVARYRRTYILVYYELTRHYRISVAGEDVIRNFRSLLDALDYLGQIRRMPLEPFVNFNKRRKYLATVKLSLDVGALPLPLQPQTLVSSAWRLSSEEYQWPIN